MVELLQEQLLRDLVGRQIFCSNKDCQGCLDWTNSVVLEVKDSDDKHVMTIVQCGTCHDRLMETLTTNPKVKDLGHVYDITDGRVVSHPQLLTLL